jgi:branched-subunit amino acid ABC-type transport system permease component
LTSVIKLELVLNGVFLGAIIGLGAVGLSLVYGILKFANIAHGDFMALGAYLGFFLLADLFPRIGLGSTGLGPFTFGYPLLLALPIVAVAVAVLAVLLDVAVYRRLRDRGINLVVLAMTSLGVAIALRGLVQIIWKGETRQFPRVSKPFYHPSLDINVPPEAIFMWALAVALMVSLYLYLVRAKTGMALQATSDGAEPTRAGGTDSQRVIGWTWALAALLAATAGVLLTGFQAQLTPIAGWRFLLDVRIPPDSIFIGALAVVLVVSLYLYLTRTKMGKAMRATSDNPDLARVSGINTQRVIWWTWAVGAVLAATAGVLLAVFQAQLIPIMGWRFLLPLFAAVILGGIGNPYGALVGAMIIGVSAEASTQWVNPAYKPAIAFAIMIVMLLVRPRGIFGARA